ncbi:hypothetical protein LXM94_21820, partial [Rhizobium sp. TRM95111]|nr:hypothetical protein [Rhizobium alarense]
MADRFRELERPQSGRQKDIVLMATVSSFESLARPGHSDLRQFAELFEPLYLASSEEARRQAVAALSRCRAIPEPTARFLARQPIGVAAILITGSRVLSDETLLAILADASPDHARAVALRDDLSPRLVEALVGHHRSARSRRPAEAARNAEAAEEA